MAVNNLTFLVPKGHVFALLGANGAGKTTTIRMICGLIPPDSGEIKIGDLDVFVNKTRAKKLIGYLTEETNLYPHMTVKEYISFFAELVDATPENVNAVIAQFALDEYTHTPTAELSKGLRRRVDLARCLVNDPEILILDEPTSGLDPVSSHKLITFLQSLKGKKTMLISTHLLHEAEKLCDQVGIIEKGSIIVNQRKDELKHSFREKKKFNIVFSTKHPEKYEQYGDVTKNEDTTYTLELSTSIHDIIALLTELDKDKAVQDVISFEPSLEQIFLSKVQI